MGEIKGVLKFLEWGLVIYGATMGYVNFKIHQALKDYLVSKGLGE